MSDDIKGRNSQHPIAIGCRNRRFQAVSATSLLWLVPSLLPIYKYTGQIGILVLPFIAFLAIALLTETAYRYGADLSWQWLFAPCITALALFAALYPIANSGQLGHGSDRDDALNVALQALLAGHYPYGVTTYLGNPPTPMPGALILALPFYLLGNAAFQNLVWISIFAWWCLRHYKNTTTALLYLLLFFIGCPASLGDFVTGGDYFINAIYVVIAMSAVHSAQRQENTWLRHAAYILLSIAISSRPIYAIAVPVLAGSIYQSFGSRRLAGFLAVVVLMCAALNGPSFLYDPSLFPTAQLSNKLLDIPQRLHAGLLLPGLAIAVACLSFFIRVTDSSIFGLTTAALAIIFYPVFAYALIAHFPVIDTLVTAAYSLPVTIFGGVWVLENFDYRKSLRV